MDSPNERSSIISRNMGLLEEVTDTKDGVFIDPISWRMSNEQRKFFYSTFSVLTVGLLHMVCIVQPNWKIYLTKSKCRPEEADAVTFVVSNESNKPEILSVPCELANVEGEMMIFISVKCKRYLACQATGFKFAPVKDVPTGYTRKFLTGTLTGKKSTSYTMFYGPNRLDLPSKSVADILITQLLSPFFIFQYFSVILWIYEDYVAFSIIILAITLFAIYTNTSEEMHNLKRLRDMAGGTQLVRVLDDSGLVTEVPDSTLAPGQR